MLKDKPQRGVPLPEGRTPHSIQHKLPIEGIALAFRMFTAAKYTRPHLSWQEWRNEFIWRSLAAESARLFPDLNENGWTSSPEDAQTLARAYFQKEPAADAIDQCALPFVEPSE